MLALVTGVLVCSERPPGMLNADYEKFLTQGTHYFVAEMGFVIGRSKYHPCNDDVFDAYSYYSLGYVISMLTV